MKIGILITLLCLFATTTYTASIKGDQKQYCIDDRDPDFRLSIGEQGPSPRGSCMLVKCEDVVEGKPILTAIGCGVFVATAGCNITDYDNTKLYPDCCPNEIC